LREGRSYNDVLLGPRSRKDDHRDAPQILVSLDLGQDFSAVPLGQVQIQQDLGTRSFGVLTAVAQECERLLALTGDVEVVYQLVGFQTFPRYSRILFYSLGGTGLKIPAGSLPQRLNASRRSENALVCISG
jgi:hypothetical protein